MKTAVEVIILICVSIPALSASMAAAVSVFGIVNDILWEYFGKKYVDKR